MVFFRLLFLQACWSFDRMQSLGLVFALEPRLKKLGFNVKERSRILARHAGEYFNTQPYMASFIVGMVAAMEEEMAKTGEKETKIKKITTLKTAAAAALAAVGDALFWASLRPFCAALSLVVGLFMLRQANPYFGLAMALTYLAVYNAPALWVRYKGLSLGYLWAEQMPIKLKQFPWQAWILRLRLAGAALAVAALLFTLWDFTGRKLAGISSFALYALILEKRPAPWTALYGATCGLGILAAAADWA